MNMSKAYKMLALIAFYNHENVRRFVTDEESFEQFEKVV